MPASLILALDQATSSSRAALVNAAGELVAVASEPPAGPDRARRRPLLLRHEAGMAARPRGGRARGGGARRAGVRDRRHLPALAADRRPRPRHRRQQRLAHTALEPAGRALGPVPART